MGDPKPTRAQGDLAETLELLLDKGVVVNADIAVSVGDTELLGIELRAAIASFETAAEYGLEFPTGTDMERVQSKADHSSENSVQPSPEDPKEAPHQSVNQSAKEEQTSSQDGE
ncbi:gas vesicle protein GvpJ [Halorubrum vacuolatum]|uniref:Gas vesicle protein n=1 Tax=Halorubrum vacuolatum TaxID=63740 RepID=A0A238YFW9_HALVU|nr:Gas vesicle protein [Halorubrum vacuolatum]